MIVTNLFSAVKRFPAAIVSEFLFLPLSARCVLRVHVQQLQQTHKTAMLHLYRKRLLETASEFYAKEKVIYPKKILHIKI